MDLFIKLDSLIQRIIDAKYGNAVLLRVKITEEPTIDSFKVHEDVARLGLRLRQIVE